MKKQNSELKLLHITEYIFIIIIGVKMKNTGYD